MNLGIIEINWSSLMILANLVILYLIMKRFFFEKIHNFMQRRQDAVRDAIAGAEAINKRADKKMEDYQRRIANVESEGRDIIRNAKVQADARAKRIVDEANEQASQIVARAQEEVRRERAQAMRGMKEEITTLALMAASKVLEEELSGSEQQRRIVDRVIEEAGNAGWQN
ncbi:MAG: F0F1 ATP synthase subunit B [Eubacteriales bacterium]|jgi:F-type H+-transporting ATPase subunit b|nr:F0F1 ATP synthase subunit B [Eubacteriales bacterium]